MLCNFYHRDVCCFRNNVLHTRILDRTSCLHEIRLSVQHSAFRNLLATGPGYWSCLQVSAAVKGASIRPYLANRMHAIFIRNQISNP